MPSKEALLALSFNFFLPPALNCQQFLHLQFPHVFADQKAVTIRSTGMLTYVSTYIHDVHGGGRGRGVPH